MLIALGLLKRGVFSQIVEALVWLPLVLPPVVLGFYLLLLFSPNYAFGAFLEQTLGIRLVFSFSGILIGSIIFSLPFMVNPLKSALESVPKSFYLVSHSLGRGRIFTFFHIVLPNIRSGMLFASLLTFMHTIGEFGVVLMLGGDIRSSTRTVSIAIYTQVEQLSYGVAHMYVLILTALSFGSLFILFRLKRGSFH